MHEIFSHKPIIILDECNQMTKTDYIQGDDLDITKFILSCFMMKSKFNLRNILKCTRYPYINQLFY